ncbi:MAG TPA: hypothetical protein VM735_02200 [Candidatus Kapabacteria bacterium]|jgi:hypothetical protein|nr:hypothetical protein [Candidatus Kapabacteria bacterium]
MKTSILILSKEELRSAKHTAKRARHCSRDLDSGTAQVVREELWRQVRSEADDEEVRPQFKLILDARRVELIERRYSDDNEAPKESSERLVERIFGAFPPVEPFDPAKAHELTLDVTRPEQS